MAGQVSVKVTDYNNLIFKWETAAQFQDENASAVDWQLLLTASAYGAIYSSASKDWGVTINGVTRSGKNTVSIDASTTKVLASGRENIKHNADGQKTFSFSFYQNFNITFGGVAVTVKQGSGTGTLAQIPKGATLSYAENFTDEGNPRITYYNPAGTTATSLEAGIIIPGGATDIQYRAISKTAEDYTFNLTDAERKILRQAAINSKSLSVTFSLKSVVAGNTYYSEIPRTMSMVNAEPTITVGVGEMNEGVYNLTGNSSTIIKNHNEVEYAISATAKKEATIKSYKAQNGSTVYSYNRATFYSVYDNKFTFTVTDSRGYTATKVVELNMIDYVDLTLNLKNVMLNINAAGGTSTAGTLVFDVEGKYFNGSFGAVTNSLTLDYRYKDDVNNTFTNWITLAPTKKDGAYSTSVSVTGLSSTKTYTLQVRARDAYTTEVSNSPVVVERVISSVPVFDWSKDDFAFNVPISIEGEELKDFVIEYGTEAMGTNGTWYWRKWKSGRADCCGTRNFGKAAISTAWGTNLYESAGFSQDLPIGLFIERPCIQISIVDCGVGVMLERGTGASASNTGYFYLCRAGSTTTTTMSHISFNCVGRWK